MDAECSSADALMPISVASEARPVEWAAQNGVVAEIVLSHALRQRFISQQSTYTLVLRTSQAKMNPM